MSRQADKKEDCLIFHMAMAAVVMKTAVTFHYARKMLSLAMLTITT